MSLRKNETLESALIAELLKAGFPRDFTRIVGSGYLFGCERGSHHNIIVGTIQAFRLSDEGGLELYVTNPYFLGEKLISIQHSNGKWAARVATGEFFEGELQVYTTRFR